MTTRLDKTLKREIALEGRTFILAVSPEGLKLTLKGKRKGQELRWEDLISGDAALAAALNASVGTFEGGKPSTAPKQSPQYEKPGPAREKSRHRPRARRRS